MITGLGIGGAEKMLCRLVAALDPARVRTSVISLTDGGTLGPEIERLGIELIRLGMQPQRPNVAALIRLRQALRRLDPDIVQTWLYHADLTGLLAARFAGIDRVVWNLRCSDFDDADRPMSLRVVQRALAALSGMPVAVVSNSEAARRAHERLGYRPRRWHVIPNAVDTEMYHPDTDAREQVLREFGLPASTLLVGVVGRCHPMKDFNTFLRAAARVAPVTPGVAFVLVGRGIADDSELARLAREVGDGGAVIMTGERADVPRLLAAFDVAVLSSYSEGFPNVVIEAMACGTPVVVTDVGDAATIVADTGVVCPPRSPDLLAQGITRMLALSRDERRALGERARQRVAAHFTLREVAARYLSLYESISHGSTPCAASQAS